MNAKAYFKKHFPFFLLLSFAIFWSALLFYVGADSIVDFLGIENSLLVVFLVSVFAGVSTFGSPVYIIVILSLSAGGVNPILLSLVSGLSLFIGDSFFFYLGHRGRSALSGFLGDYLKKFSNFVKNQPLPLSITLIYLYYSIVPLPNDILSIPLGLSHFKYGYFAIPAILGNITFLLVITSFF